jgi:RND family efflux transporter MFP subunit
MERAMNSRDAISRVVVLLTQLSVLLAGCGKPEEITEKPIPVKIERVTGSRDATGVHYSASVNPSTSVSVNFKVRGYVDEILQVKDPDGTLRNVQEGDFVKKGTVLARMRQSEFKDKLLEADAGLQKAKADFERAVKLYESNTISKADYDASYAQYQSATGHYGEAQTSLNDTYLRAPMDGWVLSRSVEVGTLAMPGSPAFVVADTRSVKAVFGVPDVVVGDVKMGSKQVLTTEALPGEELKGTITRVGASADQASRVFEVEATIPNPDGKLKAGMIASLQLSTSGAAAIPLMVVPLNAVVRPADDRNAFAVFVVEEREGRLIARSRRVKLGDVVGDAIAVTEGLSAGERVIIRGATLVSDMQPVQIIP